MQVLSLIRLRSIVLEVLRGLFCSSCCTLFPFFLLKHSYFCYCCRFFYGVILSIRLLASVSLDFWICSRNRGRNPTAVCGSSLDVLQVWCKLFPYPHLHDVGDWSLLQVPGDESVTDKPSRVQSTSLAVSMRPVHVIIGKVLDLVRGHAVGVLLQAWQVTVTFAHSATTNVLFLVKFGFASAVYTEYSSDSCSTPT